MASSNRCSVCEKGAGTCFCPGCKAYFCNMDFQNHRGMLVNGLDELTIDRNELQEKINKASSNKQSGSALLLRIDEWQQNTMEKVKQAAEQARQQVLKIMNSKHEEIMKQFQTLSQEFEQLRETEDVLEQDLTRLKQQIDRLNEDLGQLSQRPAVELNTNQSEQIVWNRMIYVEEKSANNTGRQQPQPQARNEESPVPIPIPAKLECNGHACATCSKCCDWYVTTYTTVDRVTDRPDSWKRHNGATCSWNRLADRVTGFRVWDNHLCDCKDKN